ncbi:MAG: hypothetical protein LC115_08115 [Bacteroidia bacterium]|nr:hypothetical protein [Bacteroidia bacterium]MCZ2356636.1 hypothetical protein [Bacteroidia bacterium]
MKFKNYETGEITEVAPLELRLGRMKKRLSFFQDWKNAVAEMVSDVDTIMVTLTYRGVDDWRPRHVTDFIRKVRRFLGTRMYGYFWVAEMQERGAVHYHVIFIVSKGTKLPKPDEEGYWTYGMTKIEKVKHVYAYLSKYLSKDGQKADYPKGIRIFGMAIYILKDWVRMWKLPRWLNERIERLYDLAEEKGDKLQRLALKRLEGLRKVKGGYSVAGCFIASPYRMFSLRN